MKDEGRRFGNRNRRLGDWAIRFLGFQLHSCLIAWLSGCLYRFVHDETDAVSYRRVVLEGDVIFSRYGVVFAYSGEQFGLFNRVYAQVSFHVQVQFQHILRVAGLVGDHCQDLSPDGVLA